MPAKRMCEDCGRPVKVFRKIKKPGKHRGKLRVFSDDRHTLCWGCDRRIYESEMQRRKFEEEIEE